jgi:hypothetical protein
MSSKLAMSQNKVEKAESKKRQKRQEASDRQRKKSMVPQSLRPNIPHYK